MRGKEFDQAGIHPGTPARMHGNQTVLRVTRGLCEIADAEAAPPHDPAAVAKLVPGGVICLAPTIRTCGFALRMPGRDWHAIGGKARKPGSDYRCTLHGAWLGTNLAVALGPAGSA